MATFPNGVKTFPTHKNMDTVEAHDINAIQDEVAAIERALGAGLNRAQDEQFSSLTARMAYLEKNQAMIAFELTGSDKNYRSGVNNNWAMPPVFTFPAPPTTSDPANVYNGSGATLPVAGFWILQGFVDFTTGSGHSGPHAGTAGSPSLLTAAVTLNGNDWVRGADSREEWSTNAAGAHTFLRPARMGWLPKGTKVSLNVQHSSTHPHALSQVALSGFCLRQG